MKKVTAILLLFTCAFSSAQIPQEITYNGIKRSFIYYTPSSWSESEPMPLLIVLHGLTQDGKGIMDFSGFNDIAEDNNFVVCYPDGLNRAWNANMNVSISQADDIGFIEEITLIMQKKLNTNPSRQYLCGISNGGFMSHKLACESSQCFAGIATIAGTMSDTVFKNCNPTHTNNILHIHGTADAIVNYNGSLTTGVSVDQLMKKWRSYLNCDLNPQKEDMPNPNRLDLSYPERYTYTNCKNGTLEHIKIVGGGHQWPGIIGLLGGVGTINMDFYSPQLIWDFLKDKSCNQTSSIDELKVNNTKSIIKITDLLGRKVNINLNIPLIYFYDDGSVDRKFQLN